MEGQVNIIAEERNYKKVNLLVRRLRKKRQRAKEMDPLGLNQEAEEKPQDGAEGDENAFHSDFPHDFLAKPEYKRITENLTFGNDKIITNKAFRPSFGVAEGELTKVLGIPLKLIEQSI